MGRRSFYKGEKRRKELKRQAKKEAKRRQRLEQNGEAGEGRPNLDEWTQSLANLHRASGSGEKVGPVAGANVQPPFLVSQEELEVLHAMKVSVPIHWREGMAKARKGDEVKVHYRGTLEDGREFCSSRRSAPVSFTIGQGEVIKGFEEAVVGMGTGESQTVKIPCQEAYGERRDELTVQVSRSEIPENVEVRTGLRLKLMQPDGKPAVVFVADMDDETVTLDANHPLAGQDLNFEITLVAVGS